MNKIIVNKNKIETSNHKYSFVEYPASYHILNYDINNGEITFKISKTNNSEDNHYMSWNFTDEDGNEHVFCRSIDFDTLDYDEDFILLDVDGEEIEPSVIFKNEWNEWNNSIEDEYEDKVIMKYIKDFMKENRIEGFASIKFELTGEI